jgi:hypothetical protein
MLKPKVEGILELGNRSEWPQVADEMIKAC